MDRLKAIAIKRFVARSVDYIWFSIFIEFMLSSLNWDGSIILWFVWIIFMPFEGLLVSQWNTTPGKALLGLKVYSEDGLPISLKRSLTRSLYVWVYGFWLFIPILSIFANMLAYNDCRENGSTIWDRKTALAVR